MNATSIALAAAILLGSAGFIEAQQPTVSDIAICNEEATKQTGGSALPGPRPGIETIAGKSPAEPREGSAPPGQPREKTDSTGKIITESPDPLVRGMDADKTRDPDYRTAYRDCMQQRLGKGR